MATSIDNAAAAFDIALGNTGVTPDDHAGKPELAGPSDTLFGNLGEYTLDGDEEAGGDGKPLPGELDDDGEKPKGKKAKAADPADEDPDAEGDDPDDEDADGDEDPDAEGDDPDDEDADDDLDREYEVLVDGEEVKVPLREALAGYQRTATFMKRLTHLDQAKKELIGFAEQLGQDRQTWDARLAEAEELMTSILPPEPDWDKLYEQDPRAARELQKQFDALRAKVKEVRGKREAAQKEAQEREAKETREFAEREYKKFAQGAKWSGREDAERDLKAMRETGLAAGFTEDEISAVYDSRMLNILLKAAKYDRIRANKPEAVKAAKKLNNPGAGTPKGTAHRAVAEAKRNLGRTGSVDDAARYFQHVIKR